MPQRIKLLVGIFIPLLIMLIPPAWLPIDGLSVVEQRLLALFVLAALFWILEPIPVFATSVLIIVLELIMISDQSFVLFRPASDQSAGFGTVLSYQTIMGSFASPIIMLFLGGFFLAMAATKYRLDVNLASILLRPFGSNPRYVLLGLMSVTALFSMFMSNTATTAMMLAVLVPIIGSFPTDDPARIAYTLGIPFAANIGGIGTPIGTPPNAIALKYLTGDDLIGFGAWMSFGVPYVVVMLFFTWLVLVRFFPSRQKSLRLDITARFQKNWKALVVYVTFVLTILLWLSDFVHGMNSYVVAMIPVAVFCVTGIITAQDLRSVSWDVLWLVAGGIALGTALEQTGAAARLIESIPFSACPPPLIIVLASLLTVSMASFMSNTATANLLMPIMGVMAANVSGLSSFGGARGLILVVAFSASLGMILPISTPPNALAHASGFVETKHMFKIGLIVGIIGLTAAYLMIGVLRIVNFL